MPEIAGGFGAATLAEANDRRDPQARRPEVGYINAHCVGGRLQVHGKRPVHQWRLLPGNPDLAMPLAKVIRAVILAGDRGARRCPCAAGDGGAGRSQRHRPPRRRRLPAADAAAPALRPDRFPGPHRHLRQARDGAGAPAAGADRLRPRRPPQRRWPAHLRAGNRSPKRATEAARRTCRGSIVGTGHVGAAIAALGAAVQTRAPLTIFNGPPPGSRADRRPPCPHPRPAARNLRNPRPDRTPQRRLPLPRPVDLPPLAGGLGAAHPHRRQDRPPLPRRRALPQLRLRPLQRQRPADPRPLHLRRRHRDLRRGRKVLQRQVAGAVEWAVKGSNLRP